MKTHTLIFVGAYQQIFIVSSATKKIITSITEYIVDKVELGVAQSKSSLILLKFLS